MTEQLQQELDTLREVSREIELELELECARRGSSLQALQARYDEVQQQLARERRRWGEEREAMQRQMEGLVEEGGRQRARSAALEVREDEWEQAARIAAATIQDLEEKWHAALEQAAMGPEPEPVSAPVPREQPASKEALLTRIHRLEARLRPSPVGGVTGTSGRTDARAGQREAR